MSSTISNQPLTKLNIFSFKGIQMKTFHITWLTFFACFFGWFGLAPLMPGIRADLGLTKSQVGNTIIAAVSATIFARLIIGKLCDSGDVALHFTYTFKLGMDTAGFYAGAFGFMNIFAKALGGISENKICKKDGMRGDGILFVVMLLSERCGIILLPKPAL